MSSNGKVKGYSLFGHICDGILLRHEPKETLVMCVIYSTYLDDAGHRVDKPLLTVGGFMASQDRWNDFKEAWLKCLALHKIEPPFHSTDFFSRNRKNPKLPHITRDLVRVITNHTHAAFSVTIDIHAYKSLNSILRIEETMGTPLAIATRTVYDNFDEWVAINNFTNPNLFFIESGCLDSGDMVECLEKRDGKVPPIAVPKGLEPCQAADLYCYAMYTYFRDFKKSYLLECFDKKLKDFKERRDGFIGFNELKETLGKPIVHAIVNDSGDEKRWHVPLRHKTEGLAFNFPGSKKRPRTRKVRD